jgi:NDP-sugar pyrophosphorylase family protein
MNVRKDKLHAVILAGGKGTRLAPYTTIFPKPLVPLGEVPILEIVIRQLRTAGVDRITLAVGHLSELIQTFFQDGQRFGVHIEYAREERPLGTAGPLAAIAGLEHTFLVMNGDVLTTLDFRDLLNFHRENQNAATIAMHDRKVNIDFGVIESGANGRLTNYIEKPSYAFQVSMGIYAFEPSVLQYIPSGKRFDFPELVLRLLSANEPVSGYAYDGYWMDIGRPDDYAQASEDFLREPGRFLPGDD